MNGRELAADVTTQKPYQWTEGTWETRPYPRTFACLLPAGHNVVAIDYGEKLNILRSLAEQRLQRHRRACSQTSAEEILRHKPDGIFLSNGPGDPAATGKYAVPVLQKLITPAARRFLASALAISCSASRWAAKPVKLKQGHRGANQPVKNLETGAVEITSQNHGFAVDPETLPATAKVTHVSLFDGSNEGLACTDRPAFSACSTIRRRARDRATAIICSSGSSTMIERRA